MSNNNPAKPTPNSEKFKPQNVADESAGSVTSSGRKARNIDQDVSRGSEPSTKTHRG